MKTQIENYEYFKNNIVEITKEHLGEFVAIENGEKFGYYKTLALAIKAMKCKGRKIGQFIVQKCVEDVSNDMAIFNSQVTI